MRTWHDFTHRIAISGLLMSKYQGYTGTLNNIHNKGRHLNSTLGLAHRWEIGDNIHVDFYG